MAEGKKKKKLIRPLDRTIRARECDSMSVEWLEVQHDLVQQVVMTTVIQLPVHTMQLEFNSPQWRLQFEFS